MQRAPQRLSQERQAGIDALGILAGVILTPVVTFVGLFFGRGQTGIALFWFLALLIDGAAVVGFFAIPSWRAMTKRRGFLLGLTFGLLGGLTVCNAFTIRSLFPT